MTNHESRRNPASRWNFVLRNFVPWLVGGLAVGLLVIVIFDSTNRRQPEVVPTADGSGTESTEETISVRGENATRFTTTIRRPEGPPTIQLDQTDPQGRAVRIACSTCHSVRDPDLTNRRPEDLAQFHQGMPMAHGSLACYACHNPADADTLRLADSTSLEFPQVMQLCAQCHGTQARDYEHGAHGGMNGYWDLSRGPRTRNNCIDCHDPHLPKYPSMKPTFKPRDRFLGGSDQVAHE